MLAAVVAALIGLLLGATPAGADLVGVDVSASTNGTIHAGGSTVWHYSIVPTTGGDDPVGCNADEETATVLTIVAPAAVTVSPLTLTFTSCIGTQPVTISSNTVGTYMIFPRVHDDGGGLFNIGPAVNFLKVVAPLNSPPVVTIAGVTHGATYEAGAVPAAVCNVADAEDGSWTVAATLSAVTGDQADLGLGMQTASCAAADSGGLSAGATATYSILDTGGPLLHLPSEFSVEATGPDGARVDFEAVATDDVDPTPELTCTPASGATFPLGHTVVSCTATDAVGNEASGGFTVTVVDTTPPDFVGAAEDLTAEATGPDGAAVDFVPPLADDLVSGQIAATCSWQPGATFPLGITPVTCSAADAAGNAVATGFTVTVVDTTAPVLDLPDGVYAESQTPHGTTVTFVVGAHDLVDGAAPVACSHVSGQAFPVGETVVTCSTGDTVGNVASSGFVVTVSFVPGSNQGGAFGCDHPGNGTNDRQGDPETSDCTGPDLWPGQHETPPGNGWST